MIGKDVTREAGQVAAKIAVRDCYNFKLGPLTFSRIETNGSLTCVVFLNLYFFLLQIGISK